MTGEELAVVEQAPQQMVALSNDQLRYISGTEFVPRDLRGNLPAILACVATGRALGVPDMVALRSIHVIDGRPTFSAELMVQLVRRRGHSIQGEVSEGAATVVGIRADNGDEMAVTWTLAMAERAGLASKQNWKKYPEAMLWARAVSQLCRMLFADCFAGATYVPEELDDSGAFEPRLDAVGEGGDEAGVATREGQDADPAAGQEVGAPDFLTEAQHKMIERLIGKLALDREAFKAQAGVEHMTEISKAQASRLIEQLKELEAADPQSDLPEALRG